MKILCAVLMLSLCLGCAGLKVNAEGITPEGITMESLLEKSRSCAIDSNGWKVLGVPDKDFDNNYIEFVFFTRGPDWGIGFIQHEGGQAVLVYNDTAKEWYAIVNGQVTLLSPEQAKEGLDELWTIIQENGDFDKMRCFTPLTPVPKVSI